MLVSHQAACCDTSGGIPALMKLAVRAASFQAFAVWRASRILSVYGRMGLWIAPRPYRRAALAACLMAVGMRYGVMVDSARAAASAAASADSLSPASSAAFSICR